MKRPLHNSVWMGKLDRNQKSASNMIDFHIERQGKQSLVRKLHFCPMGISVNKDEVKQYSQTAKRVILKVGLSALVN